MTSSAERVGQPGARAIDPLPPALRSMWRLCRLGYQHEPGLLVAAFVLALVAAVPDALLALWFQLLGVGVIEGRRGLVLVAALALGVSAAATWLLITISTRVQRTFRDKVTIALEAHVARLQATIGTIAHQERPEYLDRLSVLRNQVFVLDHMYASLFTTCGWVLRLGVTLALLVLFYGAFALVDGVLALAAALAAIADEASVATLTVALFLLGLGWNFSFVAGSALLTEGAPPGSRVRLQGYGDAVVWTAGAVAGLSSGLLLEAGSYAILCIVAGLLTIVPVAVTAGLRRPAAVTADS